MNQDAGLLRLPHASAIDAPGCDGRPREHNDLEGIAGTGETPVSHQDTDKEADRASEYPQCDCVNCRTSVAEVDKVRARARLGRQAVADREPWGVIAWHLVELIELLKARGLA